MRYAAVWAAACVAAIAAAAQTNAPPSAGGFAVMTAEVAFPEEAGAALPVVEAGSVHPSPGCLDEGFQVICRDAEGRPRVALLPARDEWGHVTARAAAHDAAMAPDTILVRVAAPLRPGKVVLRPGSKHPIVREAADGWLVRYAFAGYERELAVSRAQARYEEPPAPVTDPARLREIALQEKLDAARREQEALAARMERATADGERLVALLQELGQTELANLETQANLAREEAFYARLTAYRADPRGAQRPLRADLARAIRVKGEAASQLEQARLETSAMRSLHAQLAAAESELEELRTDVAAEEAALDALVKYYRDPAILKEIEHVRGVVAQIARQNTEIGNQAEQFIVLGWLSARLESVLGDNALLKQQLADLAAQYEKLKQDLQNAEAMLAADAGAPAETPAP